MSHLFRTLAVIAAAVSLPIVLSGTQDSLPPVTFHSGVDLVAVTATVQAHDGSFVTGLGAADFHVLENGIPQTISFFGASNVPVDLLLLLDNSGSMTERLPGVQHASDILIDALDPHDRVGAVTFGGAIRERIALTTDHDGVKDAIARMRTAGATPLYDAVYVALRTLGRETDQIRRRAMVVLSDGDDTASLMSYDAVRDLAHESGIAIYTVSLRMAPVASTTKTMEADYEMRALATDTGAQYLVATADRNLDDVYRSIARELAHQYSIGYVPAVPPARHHFMPISVLVPGRNVIVRARRGYMVEH